MTGEWLLCFRVLHKMGLLWLYGVLALAYAIHILTRRYR